MGKFQARQELRQLRAGFSQPYPKHVKCMGSSVESKNHSVRQSADKNALSFSRRDVGLIAFSTLVIAEPSCAGPLDALKNLKRDSNARFLLGTLRVSKERLLSVQELALGNMPDYKKAREALGPATLDCVAPSAGLALYSNVRDVCTYSIVFRSVTQGPAAQHALESAQYIEAKSSLSDLLTKLRQIDSYLEGGELGEEDAQAKLQLAFPSAVGLLDRFDRAVQSCMGYTQDPLPEA
eukprot:CAMPEP_0196590852 /NCGR_PEP_ID=MMETSP1081-20130531/67758_1 /TAXON_ID=36882 /ORGANISM="Pyramimonas amylifera, Strain CCMP720" /LENGTH=236 /DNA_ID=CAMNT_0041914059 /DNA_START=147 /DNA_END=857 /DNA_ORIENTATION=+